MSIFDRLTRVAKGKALLWTRGPSAPASPEVEAELNALRPAPAEREREPPQQTVRRAPPPAHDPAERPVPKTDLLDEKPRGEDPDKRDLL